MPTDQSIRLAFDYLRSRAQDQQYFGLSDLIQATGWSHENTRTNLSKRLSEFIVKRPQGRMSSSRTILSVQYSSFVRLFRQKNTLFGKYETFSYPDVTVYEFFLPLTCEDILRWTLDGMFFRDTVVHRLLD